MLIDSSLFLFITIRLNKFLDLIPSFCDFFSRFRLLLLSLQSKQGTIHNTQQQERINLMHFNGTFFDLNYNLLMMDFLSRVQKVHLVSDGAS